MQPPENATKKTNLKKKQGRKNDSSSLGDNTISVKKPKMELLISAKKPKRELLVSNKQPMILRGGEEVNTTAISVPSNVNC